MEFENNIRILAFIESDLVQNDRELKQLEPVVSALERALANANNDLERRAISEHLAPLKIKYQQLLQEKQKLEDEINNQ